ncbi:hypothetical protein IAT40_007598 [Kwoniella sp. CBS 6097]
MRFLHAALPILGALALMYTASAAVVSSAGENGKTGPTLARRDEDKAVLVGEDGLQISDVHQDHWGSTWFTQWYAAILTLKDGADIIKKTFSASGVEGGKNGEEVSEAEYYVHNAQGDHITRKWNWKSVMDKADYKTGKHWYIAGAEMVMIAVNTYLGTDHDKLSAGSPVDSYHMLFGQKAIIEQVKDGEGFSKQIKQNFKDYNGDDKDKKKPMVFEVGDYANHTLNLYKRTWYSVLDIEEGDKAGWEKEELTYWCAKERENSTVYLENMWQHIVQIVYPEVWPPPGM